MAERSRRQPGRPGEAKAARPWWRHRRFWQAVIVVEVLAALALSIVLAPDPTATVPTTAPASQPAQ